jgi:bZIP transcription factor
MSTMTEAAAVDPAEARKRRKEIMQSLRADGEENGNKAAELPQATEAEALPPKKRKIAKKESADAKREREEHAKKTQVRYDPEVPMDKDQLAAWRKEARRVRNRESAAASRQRIRDRITELEGEISQWKQKYAIAIERLEHLERVAAEKSD